ncbi:hypothetical protein C2W64_01968 [Brevibacillus laterosporus]|nr:hypothetical protein C2W64_01968 [Brevibacillus laterosporus]
MKNVGIPFEIKEISHNEMFMKEFISFGGKGTPFTIIKDDNTTEKVLGFNQDKLIKVLGLP